MKRVDVIIIGAGASGLMCAIEAGKRGRSVVILDHANKVGKKILMSGGGRCNFTNYSIEPDNYLSDNPHFCKSALSRYTQWDFIALVDKHQIAYHEREHGQLFCDNSAKQIRDMLVLEAEQHGAQILLNTTVDKIEKQADHHFKIHSNRGDYHCQSLVVATGGLSIPTMGASPFGYKIAEQFGIPIKPTRAGLVPFTLHVNDKQLLAPLAGIAVDVQISNAHASFREALLFTHRGISGPAVLQMSSYWQAGETVEINLLPDVNLAEALKEKQRERSQQSLRTVLTQFLPKRLVAARVDEKLLEMALPNVSHALFDEVAAAIHAWQIKPNGTEGYRTAEVTLGGVDVDAVSSKTMEANAVSGLFFVGEVLDVSGWLGGFNFQWAWASGWCAGQYV